MTLRYKVVAKSSGTLIAACQRADDAVRIAEAYIDRPCAVKWAGKIVWRSGEPMGTIHDAGRLAAARVTEINRQAYDKDYGEGAYARMITLMDTRHEVAAENSAACASVQG
jgi:hypothetical protein